MRASFSLGPGASETLRVLTDAASKYPKVADEAMRKGAEEAVKRAQAVILGQRFSAVAITAGWAIRKRRLGLDPRVLVASKSFAESFRAVRLARASYAIMAIEPLDNWHEKGTKTMPARRHREVIASEAGDAAHKAFSESIMKALFGGS